MAQDPKLDTVLSSITDEDRTLSEWLTTFPLAVVALDPFTYESAWILDTASRILGTYRGAGVRVGWLVAADADGARSFLGPLADEFLTFADEDRSLIGSLGLEALPAFVYIRQDGTLGSAAEGWDPEQWRDVAAAISDVTLWNRPTIPGSGDPIAYDGTPATTA
ncbi:MAG: hypothetical protein IH940_02385 [Acidobacteria bacterium]|nr:hypothetical protein [Acidobacteriota bacterium]